MSLSPGIARPIIYSRVCSQASCPPPSARSAGSARNAARAPARGQRGATRLPVGRNGSDTPRGLELPLGETDNYAVASALEASPPALSRVADRLATGEAGRWERGSGWGREQAGEARARFRGSSPVGRGFRGRTPGGRCEVCTHFKCSSTTSRMPFKASP